MSTASGIRPSYPPPGGPDGLATWTRDQWKMVTPLDPIGDSWGYDKHGKPKLIKYGPLAKHAAVRGPHGIVDLWVLVRAHEDQPLVDVRWVGFRR